MYYWRSTYKFLLDITAVAEFRPEPLKMSEFRPVGGVDSTEFRPGGGAAPSEFRPVPSSL